MSLVAIDWTPDRKQLRIFGGVILLGFSAIAALCRWHWDHPAAATVWLTIGVVAGGLGLTGTRAAMPFYWLWMALAFVLGNVMSRVVLVLVFFVALTPSGLLGRLCGRDPLRLKRPGGDTYWLPVKHVADKGRYERLF